MFSQALVTGFDFHFVWSYVFLYARNSQSTLSPWVTKCPHFNQFHSLAIIALPRIFLQKMFPTPRSALPALWLGSGDTERCHPLLQAQQTCRPVGQLCDAKRRACFFMKETCVLPVGTVRIISRWKYRPQHSIRILKWIFRELSWEDYKVLPYSFTFSTNNYWVSALSWRLRN